ncbi:TetR family transcriptional regulator [Spiribacter aquaticus]|uniref:TetR family transcriptional regulator n=1 Tax=Spiribacter aquaticus TaxID=1935996 RepID=A0A557RMP2_9GAMM|nr:MULTISPECIES: TetR/AcrR family transcriptional regulator [Spiribacter]TVO66450.1 TetR family transcriptional regulator [Spiribacter aquaticus]
MNKRHLNRHQKRNRILRAARDAFGREGFRATSLQMIAARADLPKSNLIYYFGSKAGLYNTVLDDITREWNDVFECLTPEADPATAIGTLVREKLRRVMADPRASRIFAMEIIHGAPHHGGAIREVILPWVKARTQVIEVWISEGKMAPVDPLHLIFMIWAITQHYADFQYQVLTLMERDAYSDADIEHITETVSGFVLRGCGLATGSEGPNHGSRGLGTFRPAGENAFEQDNGVVNHDPHHCEHNEYGEH